MNKKNKRLFAALLSAAMCLGLLAGCGHTHEWVEADCTTPKTCSICGETEGEPLEHSWTEATCTAPKTCSVCGETEGEPLGHQFTEANYQSPSVCTVCGTAEGEPLTPDFVTYGIDMDLYAVGDTADYITASSLNGSIDITGKTTLTSYDICPSFENIEAREGYECRVAVFTTEFGTDALTNGVNVAFCMADYYNIELFASAPDNSNSLYSATSVNINGENQTVYMSQYGKFTEQDNALTFTLTICAQVPVGYDGIVCGLVYDGVCEPMDSINESYSPENFVLFRMGNKF